MGKFGVRIYGLGAILLGIVGLVWADFLMQWQPVPKDIPLRLPLAYVSAAALLLAGAAVQAGRSAPLGAVALATMYLAWVLLLHAPRVYAHPANIGAWNGVAEISALAAGGLVGFATRSSQLHAPALSGAGRLIFGLCPLVFGLGHFAYADFTASMVPAWIPPNQLFWAYATGGCHVAAGLAILSGVQARLAARLLGAMFAGFVILLHAPRVFAEPDSRLEWTMLGVALSLTGAAWIVAGALGRRRGA